MNPLKKTTHTSESIHPGEHLGEMLEELGISQQRLAEDAGVPAARINEVVHYRRSITADTALGIGRALGTSAEFWVNLQWLYDLDIVRAPTDASGIE